MSQTSTTSLVLLGFKGGAVIAVVISVLLLARPPKESQSKPEESDITVTKTQKGTYVSTDSPIAPWHRINQDPAATRRFVKKERTSDETFREIYAMSGELRMEQVADLRTELNRDEDVMTDEDLERLGLPRHDAQDVINKIETEGVVAW